MRTWCYAFLRSQFEGKGLVYILTALLVILKGLVQDFVGSNQLLSAEVRIQREEDLDDRGWAVFHAFGDGTHLDGMDLEKKVGTEELEKFDTITETMVNWKPI